MAEQFCPACKNLNGVEATFCIYCGAPLAGTAGDRTTPQRMDTDITFISQVIEKAQIASLKVPPRGMALYRSGEATALRVVEEERFILGRGAAEAGKEKLVDLSEHEGYESGVSRRHALVRKTPEGYEIIDLGSTNGTWLGKQKLAPNRAYPIFSGAQVYLGRMCLYLIFQQADAKE